MTSEARLREQLVTLVDQRCVDPLEILVEDADTLRPVRERIRVKAASLAHDMLTADDDVALGVMMRVVAALYPSDTAFDPPVEWWRTPMGQVVARRVGHPTADRVSYPVAGAMLGISRQGVHDLASRGKLTRHPDGGVTPTSVRDRLRQEHPADH